MIRLFFVASARIADSILTLKFDHLLDPRPNRTYIHFGSHEPIDLLKIYQDHGIDTSDMEVVYDHQLMSRGPIQDFDYHNFGYYKFGGWITQQFFKLMALDQVDCDRVLIQDCDTFSLTPYQYFDGSTPRYYVIENTAQSQSYYQYVKKFTGQERQTDHCFVTEFMPVLKKDWVALKNQIEHTHGCHWLLAMSQVFSADLKLKTDAIWFSEYEMLGNLGLQKNPNAEFEFQHRASIYDNSTMFWKGQPDYYTVEEFLALDNIDKYNCVCIKSGTAVEQENMSVILDSIMTRMPNLATRINKELK
jgi:hypothetical protein